MIAGLIDGAVDTSPSFQRMFATGKNGFGRLPVLEYPERSELWNKGPTRGLKMGLIGREYFR